MKIFPLVFLALPYGVLSETCSYWDGGVVRTVIILLSAPKANKGERHTEAIAYPQALATETEASTWIINALVVRRLPELPAFSTQTVQVRTTSAVFTLTAVAPIMIIIAASTPTRTPGRIHAVT